MSMRIALLLIVALGAGFVALAWWHPGTRHVQLQSEVMVQVGQIALLCRINNEGNHISCLGVEPSP